MSVAGKPLHQLFEAQAARTPSAIAVEIEGQKLTYQDLDRSANQMARYLRDAGVKADVPVAVAVEPAMWVAALGVWKAGGAYLPLDPGYPEDRLRFMLQDSGAPVLITQRGRLAGVFPLKTIDLDLEMPRIRQAKESSLEVVSAADDVAYVIYTSGSTGRPKGVAVPHRGIENVLRAHVDLLGINSSDRILQFASPSFDASIAEVVMALGTGATLCLARPERRVGPALADLLRELRITCVTLPPSTLAALPAVALPDLRTILVAGEACPQHVADRWSPGRRFFNLYGPTEATIWSTAAECQVGRPVTIGKPIPHVDVYVLGSNHERLPAGVEGELYIGGVGLARGYLHRPDLTAERFVANPFGPGRLYRSGDLARELPTGDFEFLGRIDHQVKVRGFRVELGEIDAVLGEHHQVREAVAVARDQRIIAYVAPASPSVREPMLRAHLARRVPAHMLPSAWVLLDSLPRTASGKIDRAALPEPDGRPGDAGYVAPRTDVEAALAAIFAEVLGLDRVGIDDDFFELGGQSLSAGSVLWRLRQERGIDVGYSRFFESPTVRALAEPLGGAPALPLGRLSTTAKRRLSFGQERLWFLEQLQPGLAVYHAPLFIVLLGPRAGNTDALRRALAALADRHEVLRTSVHGDEALVAGSPPIEVVDLRSVPEAERREQLSRRCREAAERPFDLVNGPLMRATLFHVADDETALLINLHHMVTDGWSSGILVKELVDLYDAFDRDVAAGLRALDLQYADFAAWERQQLEALEPRLLSYWKPRLAGAPMLELPTFRPMPARRSHRGGQHALAIAPRLAQALDDLARSERCTPFMALLCVYQLLLSRYSGQEDVTVGSPTANRPRPELEALIGFFVNTLPLRTDLSGDPSFRELLARVRGVARGAFAHQELPFDRLVAALNPDRSLQSPIFRAFFVLQHPLPSVNRPGLTVAVEEWHSGTAMFDLVLSLASKDGGYSGYLEFDRDLFDADTAERMADGFSTLLTAAVAQPDALISTLPVLADRQRQRLLFQWNATTRAAAGGCVHDRVSGQAGRTPDAPAVVFAGRVLSYLELERRSNQLAHHLQRLGVERRPVALFLPRSLEMTVAVLGVLKSGSAYVPLDTSYPSERLAFMTAESRAKVVLTLDREVANLPPHQARVVRLDGDWEAIAKEPTESVRIASSPNDLVYVIYTSGSTGRPKGVCLQHLALTNLLDWQAATLGGGLRTLQLAPLSFDESFREMFSTWSTGGCLVVADAEARRSPALLGELIAEQRVERVILPVVALHQLAEWFADDPGPLASLKQVFVSGEQLRITQEVVRLFSRLGCELHNHYGPTESHVVVAYPLPGPPAEWPASPPIGRPIANTRIYVLDRHREPVPIGVTGEIYIGGAGLARGYLDRPDLTTGRFVSSPFEMSRLYRTGDLGRWRADGNLECLGRIDDQVKVRGFRVELREVETLLCEHARVRTGVVAAIDGSLAAYVVPTSSPAPSSKELRDYLAVRLPEYMVPTTVTVLERLPLTPSGKVDRKALPAPQIERLPEAPVEPRTEVEAALLAIWRGVLRLERIGVHDDFFDLGGNSLSSVRVVQRASQQGLEITVQDIFRHPTVAGLAAVAKTAPVADPRVPLEGESFPLLPGQSWFFEKLKQPRRWNVNYMVEISAALDRSAIESAWWQTYLHHPELRICFRRVAGQWRQVIGETRPFFHHFDLADVPDADLPREIELHADRLQDLGPLETGPLLAVAHFSLGPQRNGRLLVILHHALADGGSLAVLSDDFEQAYRQIAGGQPVQLPANTCPPWEFAKALVERADQAEELEYWESLLYVAHPVPPDLAGTALVAAERAVSAALDRAESATVLRACETLGVEPADIFLAAMGFAACRRTPTRTVSLVLMTHGRQPYIAGLDISRTIGNFATGFPLVLDMSRVEAVPEALTITRGQLKRVPHSGNGFAVQYFAARDPAILERTRHAQLPHLLFNYLGDARLWFMGKQPGVEPLGADVDGGVQVFTLQLGVRFNRSQGRFECLWSYNPHQFLGSTIDELGEATLRAAREIAAAHQR